VIAKKYTNWIKENYPDYESSLNKCNLAVRDMVSKFPELKVQVGRANGEYHCWCKDSAGNIVDPTSKQFRSPIYYELIAERFLQKDELEVSTGVVFLNED
jgi:hypothetical protein